MGRLILVTLMMIVVVVVVQESSSQPLPRPVESDHPLCISQLALANQACSSIPFHSLPYTSSSDDLIAPSPISSIDRLYHRHQHRGRNGHRHEHEHEHREHGHEHEHKEHEHEHEHREHREHEHEHREHREHEHEHRHKKKHSNGHHHRRHSHHKGKGTAECCRWLKAIDDRCVCTLLLRLPMFLSGPVHGYKVSVDDDCDVEYECPGRFMNT